MPWRVGALVAVVAALAPPVSAGAQGALLRVGLPSIPAVLDPATALDGAVPLIARQVFETLVQYREGSSDVEPGLATSWTVSRDGLQWTFRIRDGVRFHDGTPLTARHVAESLDRIIVPAHPLAPSPNPAGPRLLRGSPGVVKEILTPDQRTVQINLLLPYAPLLTVLAHPVFSVAHSGTGAMRWIGTGPYSVSEVSPGRITLDANPSYWAAPPRSARIAFLEAGDSGRAQADLDSRGLDLLIPAGAPSRMQGALSVPGWRIGYLAMQTEKEPFKRKKVRQAIAAALSPADTPVLSRWAKILMMTQACISFTVIILLLLCFLPLLLLLFLCVLLCASFPSSSGRRFWRVCYVTNSLKIQVIGLKGKGNLFE